MIRSLLAFALALGASAAPAQTVKIGVVNTFTGPQAIFGEMTDRAFKLYMKLNEKDLPPGVKLELVTRDDGGPNPDKARQLAQELIVRDKVQLLAGVAFTPNAMAIAPLATEAKVPLIITNAGTSVVTTRSPYIARLSMSLPQVSAPMATWAAKNGIRSVYTLVADYAPGLDSEAAFKKAFEAAGGKVVDSVRVPLRSPEFAPFVQRIKDAKPEAVFMFVPAGEQSIAFMKAFEERGLAKAGIRVIATGDLTDDNVLNAMGDPVLGVITSHHYSAHHDSPENKAFVKAFREVGGNLPRPNFMGVGGYDGMAAIAEVVKKLGAKIDGDRAMEVLKGLRLASPRGPISIDPATRDIVQTVYIRRVEKIGSEYWNVEFDRFPDVKDPGK